MMKTLFATLLLTLAPLCASANEQSWRFRVLLDNREIGFHDFVLSQQDGQRHLRSEASFEYRMLFVKLYEYQHENIETWEGDCLSRIESRTDANGRFYEVKGERQGDRFVLQQDPNGQQLPPCVMSFAYWNPEFLKQPLLLNAQNGELIEVTVSPPKPDRLEVRGDEQEAYRYHLQAGPMELFIWYSQDQQWLALETEARGGRRLRYELL